MCLCDQNDGPLKHTIVLDRQDLDMRADTFPSSLWSLILPTLMESWSNAQRSCERWEGILHVLRTVG